ncbi:MAG: efflux RND transporter permease subunit [Fibrobacterales bacterium]
MIKKIVHRYMAVFTLAFIIIILGTTAYFDLPRESAPEIKQPKIFINTIYPGVAAKDIEALVTRPIEEEIDGTSDVKHIYSTSKQGFSSITVDFNSNTNVETALRRVRERVDIAKVEIPSEAEEPYVKELNFSDQPIFIAVLSHPEGLEVIEKHADYLQDEIKRIRGVLDCTLTGKLEKELAIEIDPLKLKHYGLSLDDVSKAIRAENTTIPGGVLKNTSKHYSISISGEIKDPALFQELIIKNKGKKVKLRDLGTARFSYKEAETISRINGVPAISLNVTKKSGENLIRIADEIKVLLAKYDEQLPINTEVRLSFDQSKDIKNMVVDLENNIFSGFVMVLAVTLFFLGFRNAMFVSMAIPFSMLLSFFILQLAGITLNMVVLFSLVLALGMLVDNGIVIVENIFRHTAKGKDTVNAAIDGTREVAFPIIASTLTTILAFFPIIFMPGIMGEFMSYIPKTVIIVLSSSLFVGLVINPAVCSRFLKVSDSQIKKITEGSGMFQKVQAIYVDLLKVALRNPIKILMCAAVIWVLGIMAFVTLGKEPVFFPSVDPQAGIINLETPQGTPLELTDAEIKQIEKVVKRTPASIDNYQSTIGNLGGGMGANTPESHKSNIRLGFTSYLEREIPSATTLLDLKDSLSDYIGANIKVTQVEDGPPQGHPISYEINGPEYSKFQTYVDAVMAILIEYKEFKLVDNDFEIGKPELNVSIDREKAVLLGVRTNQIASTIRNAINGGIISTFRSDEDEYDVVIRYKDMFRHTIQDLTNLEIVHEGKRIPVSSVATIKRQAGPGVIKRKDLKRTVEIWADFKEGVENKELIKAEIADRINGIDVAHNYFVGIGEGVKVQEEATAFLMKAFLIAVMLIMMVLILQFNSLTQPLIILASVILSISGVMWGFALFGQTFSIITSGIGIISLAGVVVNNAIVLIDYTNVLIKHELMAPSAALIEAGKTRLRPVLLTAITTVVGLLPMAFGVSFDFHSFSIQWDSESSQWWSAMAWAIIYGLTFATVLTLIVVPVLLELDYKLFDREKVITPDKEE